MLITGSDEEKCSLFSKLFISICTNESVFDENDVTFDPCLKMDNFMINKDELLKLNSLKM